MRCTTEEARLPSIKEVTMIVARTAINAHTIADDALFGASPGAPRFP